MYIKKEKFVDITDNWHPNYPGNKISVYIGLIYNELEQDGSFPGRVFVCATGLDDDHMFLEYDQDCAFLKDLKNKYKYWEENVYNKIPDKVNHKWFEERGFIYL